MRLLPFRIGAGDAGPRRAQPKAPLSQQALARTHAHGDAVWVARCRPPTSCHALDFRSGLLPAAAGEEQR